MSGGIYAIVNIKNHKAYIGSTVDFGGRWRYHRHRLRHDTHDNEHLQRAWNKYSEATFEFGVLEYLDNPEELHLAEQFWMNVYREEGKELYNCGLAARNPRLGAVVSEETRRKLSKAGMGNTYALGCKHTKEELRKMRKAAVGRKHTEKTKRKISEALKGKAFSEEHRCNISRAKAGPYPAFIHRDTGEIIPAGINFSALCREREMDRGGMCAVKSGRSPQYKGWILLEEEDD